MQPKQTATFEQQISDKVYAAMETGNPARARTILNELEEEQPELGAKLRTEVLREYGVAL